MKETDQDLRLLELIHKSKDREKAIEILVRAIPDFLKSLQTSQGNIHVYPLELNEIIR